MTNENELSKLQIDELVHEGAISEIHKNLLNEYIWLINRATEIAQPGYCNRKERRHQLSVIRKKEKYLREAISYIERNAGASYAAEQEPDYAAAINAARNNGATNTINDIRTDGQ